MYFLRHTLNTFLLHPAFLLGSFLLMSTVVQGQPRDDQAAVNLHTPYHAVVTHIENLQEGSYDPERAAMALHAPGKSAKEKQRLAVQLKQVLDGEGLFIDYERIPQRPGYIDTLSNASRYVLFPAYPDIYVERVDGQWKYAAHTVNRIPEMHTHVFPYGTDKLIMILPETAHGKFLDVELWQYLGILILLIASILLHKLLSWVIGYGITHIFARLGYHETAQRFILPVARPVSVLLLLFLLRQFVPPLQLPIHIAWVVMTIFRVLIPVFVIVILYRLVDLLSVFLEGVTARTKSSLDRQLVPLIRKVMKLVTLILGTLFILHNLNFNITALLAGLSIGGLAFALAAQDTIKNFFGSLLIFSDGPFKVGDWINFDGMDGTVEEVGIRSTRIRTFYNSVIYVPNGKLADIPIDNYGAREYRRFFTKLALTYDTPPELIEAFVQGLRRIVEEHPDTRKDYYNIYFNDMGAHSLDVLFYIFFKVPDWSAELQARHEVLLGVKRLAAGLGVRFAFPTQTLHVEGFPEKKGMAPAYTTDRKELDQRMEGFFKKWKPGAEKS